ncbi:MAG: ATP-binding protein [Gammaproteobacteria bacterium]|nr:ATP-binding protein [Gammaproteobacteria bacterium]
MSAELFVGRAKELEELGSLFSKKSSSLVVIRGRRRIGKSRLAKEFAKNDRFLRFSGSPPRSDTTAQEERDIFMRQICQQTSLPEGQYDDWSKLFQLFATQTEKGRVIILFDEISWMGSKDPGFLGKLKTAWDLLFSENPQLILILCGSVSYWIEKNILASTGFMGRISLDIVLEELPLSDCNELLIKKGSKANAYEKFKLFSITGGVPRYLEEIKPKLSANENIKRLCFSKSGVLFREFNDIFHDLFTTKSHYYKKMVELLLEGSLEYSEICKRLKVEKGGHWALHLEELIQAGFLKKDYTWNIKTGKISRFNKYRLSDNYLRFYLKYIETNKAKIEKGDFEERALSSFPGWDSIMSLQFENLVLNNAKYIWKKLGLNVNDIVTHGAYFQNTTKLHQGCQIDYLIKTRHNTLFACEIKFSRNAIGSDILNEMKQKIDRLILPRGYSCWPVLIHVNGVSDAVNESEYFSRIIDFTESLSQV